MSHTFEYEGRTFEIEMAQDEFMGAPWDEHGLVSEWTTRDKRSGEWVLCEDRGSKRYYDFAEAIEIAKKDGWDTEPYGVGTEGERAVRAVSADFNWLRRWCDDDWVWGVIHVTLLDDDFDKTGYDDYLGGVEWEFTISDHIMDCARDMAKEIMYRVREEDEKERIANRFKEAMECGL